MLPGQQQQFVRVDSRRPARLHDLLAGAHRRVLRALMRPRFGAFGAGSSYDPLTSTIVGYEHIRVGEHVFIGPHAHITCDGVDLEIGSDTVIGPGFYAIAGDHRFDVPGMRFHGASRGTNAPITIGCNVWIGARVTVLKGVTVGDAAVIGAGSVVTRDVAPYAIAVGSPARRVRWRFDSEGRAAHERLLSELRRRPS